MSSTFSGDSTNYGIGEHRILMGAASATTGAITGITQASPPVVTCVGHGRATGDRIRITAVVGMTELNYRDFMITYVSADTFSLKGEDSTAYTAYGSAGTWTLYTVTDLGYTEGGSEVEIDEQYRERVADQDGVTPLDDLYQGEKVTATITFKEVTATAINRYRHQSTLTGARAEGGGKLAATAAAYSSAAIMWLHPMDDADTDNSGEFTFFKAAFVGPLRKAHPKGDDQTLQVQIKGYPDRERSRGFRTWRYGA